MITNHTQYPNLFILDVRTQSEYDESHLYNAILIPYDEIDSRISELEPYNNTEIIVYCGSGYRSAIASQNLASNHDFTKIFNMLGGITEWIIEGYPVWRNTNSEQPSISFSLTFFIIALFSTITTLIIYYKKRELKQKT
ncbi:MAG: rhodanese-like domain-containing protein [Candidatus Hodarchaeota archaeon]